MTRPQRLVLVVGTATEVGKTWVAADLLGVARRRGMVVAARKPAQSFDRADDPSGYDSVLLARATGEHPDSVCPAHRSYPAAMAPPMAADVLGRPRIELSELLEEITWPSGIDLGLVETAGGVASPLTHDAASADLVGPLAPDLVVLVADAGLGTINAVRLSAHPLGSSPLVVVLNRFDAASELHRRNQQWLETDGFDTVTRVDEILDRLTDDDATP